MMILAQHCHTILYEYWLLSNFVALQVQPARCWLDSKGRDAMRCEVAAAGDPVGFSFGGARLHMIPYRCIIQTTKRLCCSRADTKITLGVAQSLRIGTGDGSIKKESVEGSGHEELAGDRLRSPCDREAVDRGEKEIAVASTVLVVLDYRRAPLPHIHLEELFTLWRTEAARETSCASFIATEAHRAMQIELGAA